MSTCPVTGRFVGEAQRDLYGLDKPFDYWNSTDEGLARVRRQHQRAAADFAREDDLKRARREWHMAREVHDHQLMRFQLRMRYGAVDDHVGTPSYDCYIRHGEAPGYALALFMDSTRARLGRRHILDWPTAVAA